MNAGTIADSRTGWLQAGVILMIFVGLVGCAGTPAREPIHTAEFVDLERFMGDWYVIANIPTFIETGAHNAVETYRLDDDGTIATTFTFRKDGFDGEQKIYTPRGFVRDDGSNAVWGMRFIWPVKADYREIVKFLGEQGYDTSKIQKVPQRWD